MMRSATMWAIPAMLLAWASAAEAGATPQGGGNDGPQRGDQAAGSAGLERLRHCDVETTRRMPYCAACEEIVADDEAVERNRHTECDNEVERVEVCVKEYYECAVCSEVQARRGDHCDEPMVERTDYARVMYRCEGCNATAMEQGRCETEGCSEHGHRMEESCEHSGTFPHVAGD